MKNANYPQLTRIYQNHTLDSTRWKYYEPREDDVIISTSYKSGTTWMQTIVLQLLHLGEEVPAVMDASPWVDGRVLMPVEALQQALAQESRRCLKSHLPIDALPFYPEVKYIVVGRDARDVFMSWWNHYSNYKDEAYEDLNNTPGRHGDPIPHCPEDIREYWKKWMTTGWFEWESEGYPHSGNLYHTKTWWDFRHLDNILFVHFNDLLHDLEAEITKIAEFLQINASQDEIIAVAREVTFSAVKEHPEKIGDPAKAAEIWNEGINIFINKGTNGRWKEILTTEDLNLYDEKVNNLLQPECRRWLENGSKAGNF